MASERASDERRDGTLGRWAEVTVRLYLMSTATMGRDAPVPCYLIRTDDGRTILIDTGFSPAAAVAAQEPGYQGPPVDAFTSVVDRLAPLGVRPEDVDILVATHLDPDHAGMTDAFPNAEIAIQRVQYEVARADEHRRFSLPSDRWGAPGLRYRLLDGDSELVPGVDLIETGGHTPGHQSVLVRLPRTGPVLLAIDAITSAAQADPETRKPHAFDLDDAAARASARKLRDLAAREGVALTIYGHDGAQWATLKLAPDYYD